MTANKPPVIYLMFSRIFTCILLPGLVLEYTFRTLTSTLGGWPVILVFFLGVTWVATSLLASSSSGQFVVTAAGLWASGLLILLGLLFLLVVVIVGCLPLACQAISEHGILAPLREIFRGCLSVVSAVSRFLKRSSSLPISCPGTSRRDAVGENLNLRKLFVRSDIIPPASLKGTGCGAKLDIFRAIDNEVNNATHRRTQEIWKLNERFRAADTEAVGRIAAASRLLDLTSGIDSRRTQTTTIVAQAVTRWNRLGLDDYEDTHPEDPTPLDSQAIVTRMCIEHSCMVTATRRLKKTIEERENTIREQAKKFVAFKDGVHDISKRWEKTFDALDEKLKTRDAEIDSLKRETSMKNDSKAQLKAQSKRPEHLCARVDAGGVHQSFEQSDLFQEPAQRQFRRDHRATLARPLATASPSGSSSSVNLSGAEETMKSSRAGKRRILRPASN